MLENLTANSFSDFVNDTFTVYFDPSIPSDLELIEVSEINTSSITDGREPFSIVFRGAMDCVWSQGIYKIAHQKLEEIQLFLVPIGPDEKGMRYEAVFN